MTSISIYEKGICDRVIAQDLASLIDSEEVTADYITPIFQAKKDEVLEKLKSYPTVFRELCDEIIQ